MYSVKGDSLYVIKDGKIIPLTKGSETIQFLYEKCTRFDQNDRLTIDKIKYPLNEEYISLVINESFITKEIEQIDQIIYDIFMIPEENIRILNFLVDDFFLNLLSDIVDESELSYLIGDIYYFGSVEQNYSKATEFYELAAKLNSIEAFVKLGELYGVGEIVERDYNKAKEYFELVAKHNNYDSLLYLGDIYMNRLGVEKNYAVAKEYFELEAKHNGAKAYYFLGRIYLYGYGVEQNSTKAKEYLELAAKQNDVDSFVLLGSLYEEENDFTKAIDFFELGAKQNDSKISTNFDEPIKYFVKAFSKLHYRNENFLSI
ncbi:hypothetical protein M9Y10_010205 [Tritrichomonas musculus]|uniref:Sel1 repeat family protein n=1 Tax=Tritrichomonas musculus TaxID=1915356 RepID=A0ABR2IRA5_9EUKA